MPSQRKRTKNKKQSSLRRDPPKVTRSSKKKEKPFHLSSSTMKEILTDHFGLLCWGCDFVAPRTQYLQLDHINPKSEGGSNSLENRALLCPPCNALKSNIMTLTGLRIENFKRGFTKKEKHPIDIQEAKQWAKQYLKSR